MTQSPRATAQAASLAPLARVTPGTLAGTVKIISYAVPGDALALACEAARAALRILPVTRPDAGLILTEVPGQEAKLTAKGLRVTEARLKALGMALAGVEVVAHDAAAIAAVAAMKARSEGYGVRTLQG